MKKYLLLLFSLLLVGTSCTGEKAGSDEDGLQGSLDFGTRGPEADDVKILIFQQSGSNYFYKETFAPAWTNNKAKKSFRFGSSWQFMFYKAPSLTNTTFTLGSTTKVADVTFTAKTNTSKPGYILPPNEIWLPESPNTVALNTYAITGPRTINDKLIRAVSGIDIEVMRGKKESNGSFTAIPFLTGDIRDLVKSVTLDISKIGTAFKVTGPVGNTGKTFVTLDTSGATPDGQGFVKITGPLLFPNDITSGDKNTQVAITVIPTDPISYPGTYTGSAKGILERNRKLNIRVWFAATGTHSIGVEVFYRGMDPDEPGDGGIWN